MGNLYLPLVSNFINISLLCRKLTKLPPDTELTIYRSCLNLHAEENLRAYKINLGGTNADKRYFANLTALCKSCL